MAISLKDVLKGGVSVPPRILLYGVEGIGKTTFGANAPSPFLLQTEDGLGLLDVPTSGLCKSHAEVLGWLSALATEEHEYKTLVVDSLDWLQDLIWAQTLIDNPTDEKGRPVANIEDYGFGKGFGLAQAVWDNFIAALNYLRDAKGMTVILIAHTEVRKFNDPTSEPYDRFSVKLHKAANAKLREWSDCVLFANYRVATTSSEEGFGKKKVRAIGSGERLLFTEERPSHYAKNRYALPAELPLDWRTLSSAIPFLNQNKDK